MTRIMWVGESKTSTRWMMRELVVHMDIRAISCRISVVQSVP